MDGVSTGFESVLKEKAGMLNGYVKHYAKGGVDEAEDLYQEACVELFQALGEFRDDGESDFDAYLSKRLKNRMIHLYRKGVADIRGSGQRMEVQYGNFVVEEDRFMGLGVDMTAEMEYQHDAEVFLSTLFERLNDRIDQEVLKLVLQPEDGYRHLLSRGRNSRTLSIRDVAEVVRCGRWRARTALDRIRSVGRDVALELGLDHYLMGAVG